MFAKLSRILQTLSIIFQLSQNNRASRQQANARPAVEPLEDRLVFATYIWAGASGAFWSIPNAWVDMQGMRRTLDATDQDLTLRFTDNRTTNSIDDVGNLTVSKLEITG